MSWRASLRPLRADTSKRSTDLRRCCGRSSNQKQRGAERFAAAFAPRTRWGLFLRNQVIKAFAIPGLSKVMFGQQIADTLRLPEYAWTFEQDSS